MKRILLVLLVGIFLISFTSAYYTDSIFTEDLEKETANTKYGTYEITEHAWWDILQIWTEEKTKEITLEDNSESCGQECYAIKTINNLKEGSLIDDVRFYRIYDDGKKELSNIRSYEVYVNTLGKQIEVNDYEYIDTGKTSENGTKIFEYKIIGSHFEDAPTWTPYTLGKEMPEGIYEVKLVGNKKPSWSYDWQVSFDGVWSEEWAVWGNISLGDDAEVILNSPADSSTALTNLVTFNASANVTGGATLVNMSLFTNHTGSWTISNTTTALINGEYYTSSSSGEVATTDTNDYRGQTFTIGVVGDNISQSIYKLSVKLYETGTPAGNINFYIFATSGDQPTGSILSSGTIDATTITTSTSGEWYNISMSSYTLTAGTKYIFVYNVTNAGHSTHLMVKSGTPYSGGVVVYNDGGGWNTLADNDALFMIISKLDTSKTQTWNLTIPSGTTLWNVQACDSDGDCGFATSNYTLSLDSTPPTIVINAGNGTQNYGSLNVNHTINLTATDSGLDKVWLNYNGTNRTITGATSGVMNSTGFVLQGGIYNATIYANDTVGNIASQFFSWDYKVFENSRTHNTTSYETATEGYNLSVTANSSLTAVALLFNGTSLSMSNSGGGIWTYSRDLPSSVYGNNSIMYRFTYQEGTIDSSYTTYQYVNSTNLTNCVSGTKYINFTFKDEQALTSINATVDSSTWKYWLGSGTQSKELLFSNTTENPSYAFCLVPTDKTLKYNLTFQYASEDYPQRRYSIEDSSLTNSTTNKTLYLLGVADGIYVTFSIIDSEDSNPLSGVTVTVDREISGEIIRIGVEVSDSSGGVTFWLNPNYEHAFQFSKTGCTSVSQTIRPTQSTYTQILSCGTSTSVTATNLEGIRWQRTPLSGILSPGNYLFTYFIMSEKSNIANAKFELYDTSSSTVLETNASSCSPSGCTLTINYTMTTGQNIKGRYYVDIGSGYVLIEADAYWRFIATNTSSTGTIKSFWQDLMNFFNEVGEKQENCSPYKNQTTCEAVSTCQWYTQTSGSTTTSICIPKDVQNKREYSRIVAFFIIMSILLAGFNFMTSFDSFNPSLAMVLMTFIVGMGSMANGFTGQGYFYLNSLSSYSWFNNWIIFIMFAVFTFSTWEAYRTRNG